MKRYQKKPPESQKYGIYGFYMSSYGFICHVSRSALDFEKPGVFFEASSLELLRKQEVSERQLMEWNQATVLTRGGGSRVFGWEHLKQVDSIEYIWRS